MKITFAISGWTDTPRVFVSIDQFFVFANQKRYWHLLALLTIIDCRQNATLVPISPLTEIVT